MLLPTFLTNQANVKKHLVGYGSARFVSAAIGNVFLSAIMLHTQHSLELPCDTTCLVMRSFSLFSF